MGQASLLMRGHCRPQALTAGGRARDIPLLLPSDPKEERLEQSYKVIRASSTCKHPLKRMSGKSQQGHGL